MANTFTAEDLLAGTAAEHTVEVPASVLNPGEEEAGEDTGKSVIIKPLSVRDVEQITRAAKEERVLTSILTIHQALVKPKLTVDQVGKLPAGLVQFLLERINKVSGLTLGEDDLDAAVKAPLAKACFVLSKEFGWTPAECSDLTVGQILLYLEMLARGDVEETQ
ncbi:MAG: hypothetical protein GY847_09090 [Proteobacteria bacterium]|nr:hypothetical protein [Pseudomonadota bacterium]